MGVSSRSGAGRSRSPLLFSNIKWYWLPVSVDGDAVMADVPGRRRRVLSYVVFSPCCRTGDWVDCSPAVRAAVWHLVESSSSTDHIDFDLPAGDPATRECQRGFCD